ncbi:MAG: ATP-binding protein [Kofleriaceae bacterium]
MRWLLVTCLVLAAGHAYADPPSRFVFRSYGSEAGLSNLSINSLAQTSDGLLWVGTEDGLFGFDGAHFHRIGTTEGLPSSWIFSLLADDRGVWVGTAAGLRRVDRDHVDPLPRGALGGQINALAAGPDHGVWVSTDTGLAVGHDGVFTAVDHWPGGSSSAIWIDRDGGVIAGRGADLATRDVRGTWTVIPLGHDRIDQIARTPDGALWVRSSQMLWKCSGVRSALACRDVSARLPDVGELGRMLVDSAGSLWVATRRGLAHRISDATWKVIGAAEGVPARSVLAAFEDREGSLWLVADQLYQQLGRGLWRAYAADTGFPADSVWAIGRDARGELDVGTNQGVLESHDRTWVTFPGTEESTIAALADAGDVIYAGGPESQLLALDRAHRTTTTIAQVEGDNIVSLALDGADLWVATWKAGLWKMTGGLHHPVLRREVLPEGVPREDINQVVRDPRGWIWAAGSNGLAVRRDGRWRRYGERDGLADRATAYVVVRASGEVCVAYVEEHGVSCFHVAGDGALTAMRHLTHATGLASDKIYVLGEDSSGRLYVGTGTGVDIVSATEVDHVSTASGLVGDDCVARAFLGDPDGTVMIGTTRGIARFASARYRATAAPPAPVLMSVVLDGAHARAGQASFEAPHTGAASLAIDFATPTFTDRDRLEYQVRLRPLETEWHVASVDEARYAQLAPGTYRFEVRSRRVPGEFGLTTSIDLVIPPAWFQTVWFHVLGVLAIAGVLGLLLAWGMRVSAARARVRIVARSEASFRALIVQSPDCVLVHHDGDVIYANPRAATLLGFTSEQALVGRSLRTLVDPDYDPAVLADAAQSPTDAAAREVRMCGANGAAPVLEVSSLHVDFDGAPAVLTIGRDVTARKALEARLMFTDRMASIGTLAAGIAHEINNPLAYLQSNLAVIGETLATAATPELREALADASDGARRIQHIVRGVKTFSRSDEDVRSPTDVHGALESALKMIANELRHHCVVVKELGAVPSVLGNEARLGQVFINLLVNAAQAMPERCVEANQIRITTRTAARGEAVIEIADNGQGMTPQLARRIFEPFFTTKDVGKGTGLGLSVCHGIVERFGGQIAVESAVGVGTTFRITLPAAPPNLARGRTPTQGSRAGVGERTRLRVLVIDDDALLLKSIGRNLGQHEITACGSAVDALARLRAGDTFDAILSDLMMPGFTGMQFHAELTALRPELAHRVLFMTGGAFTTEAQTFLEDPDIRSIEKPFAAADVRARILELVSDDLGAHCAQAQA